MNTFSRMITGVPLFTFGLAIVAMAMIERPEIITLLGALAWGGTLCGIGVYLLLNTKEDEVEKIKNNNKEK